MTPRRRTEGRGQLMLRGLPGGRALTRRRSRFLAVSSCLRSSILNRERRTRRGHEQFDLLFRALAGLDQWQAEFAGVHAGDAHRVLDADRVAVEEDRLDQR